MTHLLIGSEHGDHVLIELLRRAYPHAHDYSDGNWLDARLRIHVGEVRVVYDVYLRAEEFVGFRRALAKLSEHRSGFATFKTEERWIRIHVTRDGHGRFKASCTAKPMAGTRSPLRFALPIEEQDLPALLRALDEVQRQFPVRGHPRSE